MLDVFVSYAREDREQASRVVDWLQQRGYCVWWDRDLVPGRNYGRQIEEILRQAQCVVVLWTHDSIASDFVQDEARIALKQEKLVQVLLDDSEPPVGFGRIHAAELRGWGGDADHPGIQQLEAGIRACHQAPPQPPPSPPKRWIAWLGLSSPSLLTATIVFILARWPATTTVDVNVITNRVSFHTTAVEPQTLFDEMRLSSLAVRGFGEVTLPKQSETWMTGSGQHDIPMAKGEGLVLRPMSEADDPARLSIRPANTQSLSIDRLSVRSGDVTLDAPEPGRIGVTLRDPQVNAGVSWPVDAQMIATACKSTDANWPGDKASVILRSRVYPSYSLRFASGKGDLRLVLGLVTDANPPAILAGVAANRIEFQEQTSEGAVRSTVLSGTLEFPNHGRSQILKTNDFLILEGTRQLLIRGVQLSGENALHVGLYGRVGEVVHGPKGYLTRERFTVLSYLAGHPVLAGALGIVAWLLPTLSAWRWLARAIR
jgi:TIR domain